MSRCLSWTRTITKNIPKKGPAVKKSSAAAGSGPDPAGILFLVILAAAAVFTVIAAALSGLRNGYVSTGFDRFAWAQVLGTLQSCAVSSFKLALLFLFYSFIADLSSTGSLWRRIVGSFLIALPVSILFFVIPLTPFSLPARFQILICLLLPLLFICAVLCASRTPSSGRVFMLRKIFGVSSLRRGITLLCLISLGASLVVPAVYLARTSTSEGASVLFISIDTLRAGHLGCYGYQKPISPHIDRLASRSAVFTQCLVQDHWTLPSHMSMMTSLYPDRHQVYPETTLPDGLPTLAQQLFNAGYRTQAYISGIHWMAPDFGFRKGFLDYDFPPTIIGADDIAARAVGWLEKNHRKPFFLFLHFFDAHADSDIPPYYKDPLAGDRTEEVYEVYEDTNKRDAIVGGYDAGIRYVDHHIGEILRTVEDLKIKNLVVVLTSDHGEEFFDHGMIGHLQAYEETARVPLIVKTPDMEAHRSIGALVQIIDIAPTILDHLGLPIPPVFQGRSFLPLLGKEKDIFTPARVTYIKGNWKYVIRTDRWKLFWNARENRTLLFDLTTDPAESVDLAASRPRVTARLKEQLERFLSHEGKPLPDHTMKKKILTSMDQEKKEKLKELGYIW